MKIEEILTGLYPELDDRALDLAKKIFASYDLSDLTRSQLTYLAVSVGTFLNKVKAAEDGDLHIDEEISLCVKKILNGLLGTT